ncbi:MAG: peroxiredoxin family protein [Proteobacteria bacterium]|nr:peroxiredoxin family protein [Pseudomonadota bacterium]
MSSFLDVGDLAPEISLPSTEGPFSLHERLAESAVLLVFYPKDKTLVCTRQLCNYRDHLSMFEEFGVQVVGINQDALESHEAFSKTYKFGFPLVSDVERKASHAYGALLDLFKLHRVLVLVGEDGRIWWRHSELRLFRRDAEELRRVIADLRASP